MMTTLSATVLDEPDLEFRYGQRLTRPQTGLSLFGPLDADSGSRPGSMSYGVIGTPSGVAAFSEWSQRMRSPVPAPVGKRPELWPMFPGFDVAFALDWHSSPAWIEVVDRERLLAAANNYDKYARVNAVVNAILRPIEISHGKRDERPAVIVCVVPDEVWKTCRPTQEVSNGTGERLNRKELSSRLHGNRSLFDTYDRAVYQLAPDFRRQLKARAMQFGIPIQIIRESTLSLDDSPRRGARGLTPLSDRMWNLATALYYKAGGKPWRLASAREGVCYVGIAFRIANPDRDSRNGCCAAQMFLDDGDGVVFLGESGPWYAPKTRQFHLTPNAAENLLSGVIETYENLHGKPLTEVFLHSRSGIDPDEFEGYRRAVPPEIKVVAVRVRHETRGVRLYRQERRPVIRGTFARASDTGGFLWASGFKPELSTYDGWDVPVPLSIDVQHGEADIERVARDIYGLTKLNYNSCKLGDSSPVTVGFSDAVGEILISNPGVTDRRAQFRFYI